VNGGVASTQPRCGSRPPAKKGNLEITETRAQSWRPQRRRAIQKSGGQITMALKQQFYGTREFIFRILKAESSQLQRK